jgi:polyisoprenoid-binding protein YceI
MTQIEELIPTGTWASDPVHSSIGFAVKHMGVSPFRGGFKTFEATLADGKLVGTASVETIQTDDENLTGHLLSPEFFDAERHPRVSFVSTGIRRSGDGIVVEGELEIRGVKQPVTLTGTVAGPVTSTGGQKLGIHLETVIDRTSFGMTWNMELPEGGPVLENEVTLTADLELAKA